MVVNTSRRINRREEGWTFKIEYNIDDLTNDNLGMIVKDISLITPTSSPTWGR